MAITVGLFGGDAERRAAIQNHLSQVPTVLVTRTSSDLPEGELWETPPTVVLLAVPGLHRRREGDPFYELLTLMQSYWPDVRVAVCADSLEPGAALDLTRAGVLGIVLWADARPDLWPLLVRSVFARTLTWSRPFDSKPIRRALQESTAGVRSAA